MEPLDVEQHKHPRQQKHEWDSESDHCSAFISMAQAVTTGALIKHASGQANAQQTSLRAPELASIRALLFPYG
jgi:hypothetical protein